MRLSPLRSFALLAVAVAIFSGCAHVEPKKPAPAAPVLPPATQAPRTYWAGDGIPGRPSIAVSLSQQRAYFYRDEQVVGESGISSGRKGFETPPGDYQIIQKDKDHVSNLYGKFVAADGTVLNANADVSKEKPPEGATFEGAKMPYFLRFSGGYGLHAGALPGRRASHGCVRLPKTMARHFFENAEIGMAVQVLP